jgi:hypothetical protein
MKIRSGFVSNSSSTSYYITNRTDQDLTLEDFVRDAGPDLLQGFLERYGIFTTLKHSRSKT